MQLKKQVNADHYDFNRYISKGRWSSFFHQAQEITVFNPTTVLEVGVGPGILGALLRKIGLNYQSIDIADDLGADHVGSVTELPFEDRSFDVIGCFEVLEHIEYELLPTAMSQLFRVAGKAVVISVPDALSVWQFSLWIPRRGHKRFLMRRPFTKTRPHVFDGEHHWEINKQGFALDDVKSVMISQATASGFRLERTYRVWENPYHRFFVFVSANDSE